MTSEQSFHPTRVHHCSRPRQAPATGPVTAQGCFSPRVPELVGVPHEEVTRRVASNASQRLSRVNVAACDLDEVAAALSAVERCLDAMEARRRAA